MISEEVIITNILVLFFGIKSDIQTIKFVYQIFCLLPYNLRCKKFLFVKNVMESYLLKHDPDNKIKVWDEIENFKQDIKKEYSKNHTNIKNKKIKYFNQILIYEINSLLRLSKNSDLDDLEIILLELILIKKKFRTEICELELILLKKIKLIMNSIL